MGVGVEGYRCLSGCWCGRVQVCGWVLVWRVTGVWVGVGVEGTGGWLFVLRDTGEC